MKLIQLTELNDNSVVVNFDKVDMFRRNGRRGTDIYFSGDTIEALTVIESVEWICQSLKEANHD